MSISVGPISGPGPESVLAARAACPRPDGCAAPAVGQVAAKVELPLDRLELTDDILDELRQLRAGGPGVPLFTNAEAPEPAGRSQGIEAPSSETHLRVDAFG